MELSFLEGGSYKIGLKAGWPSQVAVGKDSSKKKKA
jgi:hypothetical protein